MTLHAGLNAVFGFFPMETNVIDPYGYITMVIYETYGEKENTPSVLVHGLGAEHNMWLPQISKYPSQSLFVIAPDMRGHGNSSKVKSFKISDCAKDINELLKHLGITKANLVGVSMGGLIVQQFACDFPEKVGKLVIVDSFSEVRTFAEKLAGWMQWLTIKVAPGLLSKSLGSAYKGPDKAQALRYLQDAYYKRDKDQLLYSRAEVNRFNIIDRLGEIKAPTLVLVGDGLLRGAMGTGERKNLFVTFCAVTMPAILVQRECSYLFAHFAFFHDIYVQKRLNYACNAGVRKPCLFRDT
jgi:3-oxoadipate enol-lactonase